jgi:tetratricopeptide (TPR) repeat protein
MILRRWCKQHSRSLISPTKLHLRLVIDRAVALNPNTAIAWLLKGWFHAMLSQPQPAIEAFNQAMRLSPLDPLSYLNAAGFAYAHLMTGRFEQALEWANRALDDQPRLTYTVRTKIVANVQLGRLDDARAELKRLLALQPGYTIAKHRAIFARAVSGLAESGFPREAEGRSLQPRFGFVRVPWPDPIRRICANAW